MSRELLQQALETIQIMKAGHCVEEQIYMNKTIAALKAELAKPELDDIRRMNQTSVTSVITTNNELDEEPVAFMTYKGYLYHAGDPKVLEHSDPTPLYDKPPRKEQVWLTDEQISLMAHNDDDGDWIDLRYRTCWLKGYFDGGLAVQTKLKELNV